MTIYEEAPVRTDTFAVAATPLTTTLNWTAVQVIVDNPTTWWLYLPAARRYIRPGLMGAVVPFPGSTEVSAQWQAPIGYSQPTPIAGQEATLIWLSAGVEASPHPGVAAVVSQQQSVQASVIAPAAGSNTVHVPIPSGTLAIGFGVRSEAIPSEPGHFYQLPQLVSIIGDQTDIEYFATTVISAATAVLARPFDPSDTTVQVSLTAAAGDQSKIDVLAWPIAISVAITQNPGDNPIAVVASNPGNGQPLTIDTGLDGTEAMLGVSMNLANPAPWQRGSKILRIAASIAAGATAGLLAANANVTLYLFTLSLGVDAPAAGPVVLQDTNGNNLHDFETTASIPNPFVGGGTNLTKGLGIQLHNFGAGTLAVRGSLVYTPA